MVVVQAGIAEIRMGLGREPVGVVPEARRVQLVQVGEMAGLTLPGHIGLMGVRRLVEECKGMHCGRCVEDHRPLLLVGVVLEGEHTG